MKHTFLRKVKTNVKFVIERKKQEFLFKSTDHSATPLGTFM